MIYGIIDTALIKGVGKKMNQTDAIRKYITNSPETVIDVSYLHSRYFPLVDYRTFIKILKRLSIEGLIKQVDRGVYVLAEVSDENIEQAVFQYYMRDTNGMVIGDTLYSDLGISTRKPEMIRAYTNRLPNGKQKHVLSFELIGADVIFDEPARKLVTVLELMEHREDIDNLDYIKYIEIVNENITVYSDDLADEITSAINYREHIVMSFRKLKETFEYGSTI